VDILGGIGSIVNSVVGIFTSQAQFNKSKRLLRLDYTQKLSLLSQAGQIQKEAQKSELEALQIEKAQSKPYVLQNTSPDTSFFGEIEQLTQGSNFIYIIIGIALVILLIILRQGKKRR